MALQVPKSQSVLPSSSPTYQTTRGSTPAAFGAGVGQAMQGLGQSLEQASNVATQLAQEDFSREAKTLDIEYAQASALLSYGDGSADNPGFYSLEKQNALDAVPGMQANFAKLRDQISAKASSSNVRATFAMSAAERDAQRASVDGRFITAQRAAANDSVSEARLTQAISDAAQVPSNPDVLDHSIKVVTGEIITALERQGKTSPVELAAGLEAGRAAAVVATFEAAIKLEDYSSATKIFSKYKDKVGGVAKAKMFDALQDSSMRVQAQTLSAEAFRLFPTDPTKGAQWLRQAASGKVEDFAMQVLRDMFIEQKLTPDQERQTLDRARQDLTYAHNKAEQSRAADKRAADEAVMLWIEDGNSVLTLPADLLAHLSLNEKKAWEKRAADKAAGIAINTDYDAFFFYTGLKPEQSALVDLAKARTQLGDDEFTIVRAQVANARQGKGAGSKEFTAQQLFNARADGKGLSGTQALRELRGKLNVQYMQEIIMLQAASGNAPLNNETMNKIIDQLIVKVVTIEPWWRPNTIGPLFEVRVPPDLRDTYTKEFINEFGRGPTEADLQRWHLKKQAEK